MLATVVLIAAIVIALAALPTLLKARDQARDRPPREPDFDDDPWNEDPPA
jgi:hypothetical protein